jgi:hypothetical protein
LSYSNEENFFDVTAFENKDLPEPLHPAIALSESDEFNI